jgi:hypothetical protein
MRLPTEFNILGHKILVGRVKTCWDNDDKLGQCDTELGIIRVKEGLLPSLEENIVLHEVIHMISEFADIPLDEDQVVALGNGLYQFLKDNNFDVRKK